MRGGGRGGCIKNIRLGRDRVRFKFNLFVQLSSAQMEVLQVINWGSLLEY